MQKNKTVLITGSNRGIGKALLPAFAEAGFDLVAHARAESDAFQAMLASLSEDHKVHVRPIYFDMADTEGMKSAMRTLAADKITIDVLVNNAGVAHGGLFQMTAMQKIREVYEVNLFAQMQLTQLLLRPMIKLGKGSIINMASISGIDIVEGNAAYGCSKAALIAFTKTLAAECGSLGVRVNAIAPGLTDTEMGAQMHDAPTAKMLQDCAMHRKAKPEEIAKVAVFLASEDASFVNGQVVRVDGGVG